MRSSPLDVEERLVDRDRLDDRRRLLEDRKDLAAGLHVGREPRRDDDRLRAEVPRAGAAHRRSHAARPRLVAGRQHHARADDHRPPAQPGSSRCSTAAKNASRSAWRIEATDDTNIRSHIAKQKSSAGGEGRGWSGATYAIQVCIVAPHALAHLRRTAPARMARRPRATDRRRRRGDRPPYRGRDLRPRRDDRRGRLAVPGAVRARS